jgi:hypothetical protein
MTPTRSPKFLRQSLLSTNLLSAAALSSGCGPDGAGTIHIESPKARKQMMQTGAGTTPTPTIKLSPSATHQISVPRSAIRSHARKQG